MHQPCAQLTTMKSENTAAQRANLGGGMAQAYYLGSRRASASMSAAVVAVSEMAPADPVDRNLAARGIQKTHTGPGANPPDTGDRHGTCGAGSGDRGGMLRSGGEKQFIIVAAGSKTWQQARVGRRQHACRRRQRQCRQLDDGGHSRLFADVTEIGDQPVRNVDHRVGEPKQRRAERDPRFGKLETPNECGVVLARKPGMVAAQHTEPSQASQNVPETQISSPGRAPLRRISAPAAISPIAVKDNAAGPGVDTESPPSNATW